MNINSSIIRKIAFSFSFLLPFSVLSQNSPLWKIPVGASQKLFSYRKHIVSETYNFVLENTKEKSKIRVLNPMGNGFIKKFSFPTLNSNVVITAFNERLWVINEKNIEIYSLLNSKKIETIPTPSDISISNLTVGYGNTAFLIDSQKSLIYVLNKGKFTFLAEDERLKTASSMLIIGGIIYIGTQKNILAFNIAKKTFSVYADNLKPVLALDTDHLMNVVALTNENVIRINTKNETEIVLDAKTDFISISFNPEVKKLYLLDKKGVVSVYDYLALTHESSEEWTMKSNRKMKPFETKDLILVGSEYIIHSRNDNPELRENVLEGFYPEKNKVENGEMSEITPNVKTMECAEKSFQAFQEWSKKVSAEFKNTVLKGTPPTFWLMVNDYSEIIGTPQDELRKAKLWYWKRKPAVLGRFPGFWKWEAVLNQNGQCELPNAKEADKYFVEFNKSNPSK
jgi:hypothetical protein